MVMMWNEAEEAPPMRPFPEVTDRDVILLTGVEYLTDRLWKEQFGQEIEYRYRPIPFHLLYMLRKYGPVITHSVFVDSIQDVCGLAKRDALDALKKQRL